jgi:hypothetical protein
MVDSGGSVACNSMDKIIYHKFQTQCLLFASRNSVHCELFTVPAEHFVRNENETAKIIREKWLTSVTWEF